MVAKPLYIARTVHSSLALHPRVVNAGFYAFTNYKEFILLMLF